MGTNKQVFGSGAERSNYYKLSRQWGSAYRIYHNLPFLNVFNTKGLLNAKKLGSWSALLDPNEPEHLTIGDIDSQRLKKTSIDYTLCDTNDRPLLCIEFDGMKDGYNVGTEYRFDGPHRVNASKSSFIIATPLIGTSVQAYDSYGCHPSSGESHGRYFSRGLN